MWVPLLAMVGGGAVLAMNAPHKPQPPRTEAVFSAGEDYLAHFVGPLPERRPMGPFPQVATVPLPPTEESPAAEASPGPTAAHGPRRLAGSIGPAGPITGPLNTNVSGDGVITGPQWGGKPLPLVTAPLLMQRNAPAPVRVTGAGPHLSDTSSELPDARKVALSRLVTAPQAQAPARPAEAAKGSEVSAEKPLSLNLSVNAPAGGSTVGETVAVRMSANADCYAALIRVNTAGQASVVFRSPAPSRSFACAVRSGPGAGAEYLVAIASVHPLSGAEAASAIRGSGAGFSAVRTAEGGAEPGAAWTQAVAQAGSLSGPSARWQRYEWSVATGSFGVRAPKPAPVAKRPAEKATATRPAPVKPVPAAPEGSALPGAEKPGVKSNPPAEPAAPKSDSAAPAEGKKDAAPANNEGADETGEGAAQ